MTILLHLSKSKYLIKYSFKVHKFHGDSKNYHAPVNSYINTVLESKKGESIKYMPSL